MVGSLSTVQLRRRRQIRASSRSPGGQDETWGGLLLYQQHLPLRVSEPYKVSHDHIPLLNFLFEYDEVHVDLKPYPKDTGQMSFQGERSFLSACSSRKGH